MTRRQVSWAVLLVLAAATSAAARAETLVLKGGHRITGNVLKSDSQSVVIEVGSTVLRLERAEIVSIEGIGSRPATAPTATAPAEGVMEKLSPAWQLYRTAELPTGSIEENSRRFGEAVVMVTSPGGQGSGFVITPDGYCITNYHVIERETRIQVTVFRRTETGFEQKNYKKVRLVALNPSVDLALLKIEGESDRFAYAFLGSMDELEAGQEVFAIGNPLGLTRTVSQGIVSTRNRNYEGHLYIQTTTDINPGNSGGPLFNMKGEVIGVTSMGYLFLSGLNFAIPVDVVKRFILNRDAFAYDEDNDNSGFRYLQPGPRREKGGPPPAALPEIEATAETDKEEEDSE